MQSSMVRYPARPDCQVYRRCVKVGLSRETAVAATLPPDLARTALHEVHRNLGAVMTAFAGYEMPVRYKGGIIAEHLHTRAQASLFDISHMGQIAIRGRDAAAALETLVPGDIRSLETGGMRYTLLTSEEGGILDDLIVTNVGSYLFLVVNAARKSDDIRWLRERLHLPVNELDERSLLALQGPAAARVVDRFCPGAGTMRFMSARPFEVAGCRLAVMRSGYTGEDGFEISVPSEDVVRITEMLLAEKETSPAGLGARNSLRLEAALCLYGEDIDETTTPVEAGLSWTIPQRRREERNFPGADRILGQLQDGASMKRVGIVPDGRVVIREGAQLIDQKGKNVGRVTSGGFGPSVDGPISMGYVDTGIGAAGTLINALVRGRARPCRLATMPFVRHRYYRGEGST